MFEEIPISVMLLSKNRELYPLQAKKKHITIDQGQCTVHQRLHQWIHIYILHAFDYLCIIGKDQTSPEEVDSFEAFAVRNLVISRATPAAMRPCWRVQPVVSGKKHWVSRFRCGARLRCSNWHLHGPKISMTCRLNTPIFVGRSVGPSKDFQVKVLVSFG